MDGVYVASQMASLSGSSGLMGRRRALNLAVRLTHDALNLATVPVQQYKEKTPISYVSGSETLRGLG